MKLKPLFALATTFVSAFMLPPAALAQAPAVAQEAEAELLSAQIVISDLDALYTAMQEASVDLYAYRSKEDFDAYYAGLRASVTGPMTRLDAALLYQRLAAFARIGHIRSYAWLNETFAEFGKGAKFAPIFIRVEPNGRVYLTDHANADASAPAGARVLAVNDRPIARVLSEQRGLVSAERDYMANTVLEDFFPALFFASNRDLTEVTLTLMIEGKQVQVAVPLVTFGEYQSMGSEAPVPSPTTDFNTREFRLIGESIAYLRPGPFSALGGERPVEGRNEAAMVRFLDDSFVTAIKAGARDLIIDLRNNTGGDNSFSDPMIAWFADRPFQFSSRFTLRASAPVKTHYDKVAGDGAEVSPVLARLVSTERAQANGTLYDFHFGDVQPRAGEQFEGRIWVLVNRKSYSNATAVAAIIKDYGFGTIMGEETADVPTSFASIFPYALPATGMGVDLAKSYFIRPNGDETVRGVMPDVTLPRQVIGSGDDTMLGAALEAIRAR